jgi:AcrR family transcriptional regulator
MFVIVARMASGTSSPPSRRERPAKPALTREGIVAAAVAVLRAEGLERTTMRRVAQELDTGAASLYVYVRNTAELYAAILDELLGGVDLSPAAAPGDWRGRLSQILTSYSLCCSSTPAWRARPWSCGRPAPVT